VGLLTGVKILIPVKLLQSDGTLVSAPITANSLREVGSKEPEGVYTVARTFNRTRTVLLEAHLERLEESARLENIPVTLNRAQLRTGLAQMIEESGYAESRFRITIPKEQPDQIWLATEPLQRVPAQLKRRGVMVATCEILRPNPKAKSNVWVGMRDDAIRCMSEHAYEGIILSAEGYLMEGFGSNIYVIHEQVLHTADHGILHGIARRIVLQIAPDFLPVRLKPIHKDQLSDISEAFLTSSSRGIVPVVQIDQIKLGTGGPGEMTRRLSQAYDRWVEEHIQPIA
jgi:branched-chain amino acid aminotransferase